MQQITPQALKAWLDDPARTPPVLLDVREPWEVETCALDGARHVPMNAIPARASELDAAVPTVVVCHHGGRSMQVAFFLERQGFAQVFNLAGGVDAWAKTVDPSMPQY
jgi:rhodanese-related sulfurtransferase